MLATTVATTIPVPPGKSNAPSFADVMAEAKLLGEQHGKGKDTQIKFVQKVFEAAYAGTLSTAPDKHGSGRSDAVMLAEAYVRATQGAVIFDVKADKTRKQVSCIKKVIEVAVSTQWGRGQPEQFFNEFVEFWKQVRAKNPLALKKAPNGKTDKDLNDINNAVMRLFTAQKKSASLLSENERNAYAFKTDKEEVTEVEKLEKARKLLQKSGDNSAQIVAAVHSITTRLANIAKGIK